MMGNGDPLNALQSFYRVRDRSGWTSMKGFYSAAAVEVRTRDGSGPQVLWPLVAMELREKNSLLEISLRVGIFYLDSDQVAAYGWRFDSADSDGDGTGLGFHHYPHVQQISSWEQGRLNFMPPKYKTPLPKDVTDWVQEDRQVLETRPAFPLACSTPAGLMVAVLVAIYGGRGAMNIVAGAGVSPMREFHSLTSNRLFGSHS